MDVFAYVAFSLAAATLAYAATLDEKLKKQSKRIEQLERKMEQIENE